MGILLKLDHIVVSSTRLQDGIAYVEDRLGVTMAPGGKHAAMGTHNALLGLGDAYLEVIAIDPDAPAPDRPRWFGLDSFTGAPRLTNWVVQTTDLAGALALAPPGTGTPMALSRGDLHWTIAVSADGTLPYNGAFPGFIDWGDAAHPTTRLPDVGCRLRSLAVSHPQGAELSAALSAFDGGLQDWVLAAAFGFAVEIDTPSGAKVLR
jgi:hypothetical protein